MTLTLCMRACASGWVVVSNIYNHNDFQEMLTNSNKTIFREIIFRFNENVILFMSESRRIPIHAIFLFTTMSLSISALTWKMCL